MTAEKEKEKKTKDIVIFLTYSLLGGYVLVDWLNFEPLYKRTYNIMILHKKKKKKQKSKIMNVTIKGNTTVVLKFYFQNISSCKDTKLTLKN